MKFPTPIAIKDLAIQIGAKIIGDENLIATGINEIHKVETGDITFVDVEKYFTKSLSSAASIILLNKVVSCPTGKALLVVENPFAVYDQIVRQYRPFIPLQNMVHISAKIHPTAIIEANVIIGPHVEIGANCHIQANVTIHEYSILGNNVVVQSGSIIGSDAFYFKKQPEGYQQWRSGGKVVIEDDVLIGAGCTIAKGVSGITRIGTGSKLDAQVHIGHGAVLGKKCLLAAQVGIGGKTIVGDEVVLYGQVGIAQSLTIGDRAIVLAKSGVSKNLDGGKVYFGYPATEAREKYRELATLRRLAQRD